MRTIPCPGNCKRDLELAPRDVVRGDYTPFAVCGQCGISINKSLNPIEMIDWIQEVNGVLPDPTEGATETFAPPKLKRATKLADAAEAVE